MEPRVVHAKKEAKLAALGECVSGGLVVLGRLQPRLVTAGCELAVSRQKPAEKVLVRLEGKYMQGDFIRSMGEVQMTTTDFLLLPVFFFFKATPTSQTS